MSKCSFAFILLTAFATASVTVAHAAPEADLTFGEAYKEILGRSLRIETQKLNVQESESRKLQAWGNFMPSVTAELVDGQGEFYLGPRQGADLKARVNLFKAGGDLAGVRAARADVATQGETLHRETQGAEDDAANALINYIAQARLVDIEQKLVDVRTESLRIARERFKKGLLPQQEVDKTAIDLDITVSGLADAQSAVASTSAALTTYLGHSRVKLDWPWRDLMISSTGIEATSFDINNRPDVKTAAAAATSSSYLKRQQLASLLPSLDFSLTYGASDLSNPSQRFWTSYVTLSMPLFDGFRNWGNYSIQSAEERKALIAIESLRRSAPAEVANLRTSYNISRQSALAREKTAEVTSHLYNDNLQRFRMGRATANDIAIDQNRLLTSQQLEVQGWLTAHLSLMKLCHSLGGFMSPTGNCQVK